MNRGPPPPPRLTALLNADLRIESSFQAGIAPAQGRPWPTAWLILRNNVAYPLIQGFIWALLKDWMAVASVYAHFGGTETGRRLRIWFAEWIGYARRAIPAAIPAGLPELGSTVPVTKRLISKIVSSDTGLDEGLKTSP